MATVKEVITDALEEINYLASEEPIEPADGQTAIRYLNDMITMWDALGIKLGFTKVSNMGDSVSVTDGALFGIKKILAISLAPKFKSSIPSSLVIDAGVGWKAILNLSIKIRERNYPSILPIGSGNYFHGRRSTSFYPNVDTAVYTEGSGTIVIESGTEIE